MDVALYFLPAVNNKTCLRMAQISRRSSFTFLLLSGSRRPAVKTANLEVHSGDRPQAVQKGFVYNHPLQDQATRSYPYSFLLADSMMTGNNYCYSLTLRKHVIIQIRHHNIQSSRIRFSFFYRSHRLEKRQPPPTLVRPFPDTDEGDLIRLHRLRQYPVPCLATPLLYFFYYQACYAHCPFRKWNRVPDGTVLHWSDNGTAANIENVQQSRRSIPEHLSPQK